MPRIWNTSHRKKGILNSTSYSKWKKAERKEEGHWLFRAVCMDFTYKAVRTVKMNLCANWLSDWEWCSLLSSVRITYVQKFIPWVGKKDGHDA